MAEKIKESAAKVGITDVPGWNWTVIANPEYNKFDYQKDTGISDLEVKKLHTCTVNKEKLTILPYPGKSDPMLGLQLDMKDDKTLFVSGMRILSPFQQTSLQVGWQVFCINGVKDFESLEMAEEGIKTATKVTLIAGWTVDGKLMEFTGKDEFIK